MRPRNRLILRVISFVIIVATILSGCGATPPPLKAIISTKPTSIQFAEEFPIETADVSRSYDTITIAPYPFIPDIELFEALLADRWKEIAPDVKLEFVYWDCYKPEPPDGIDIIMYDTLFTSYLAEYGYIQPISFSDIQNRNEKRILPFAVDGAVYNGELYGIPYLACAYFLMHAADDVQLAEADNFAELYSVISERKAVDSSTGLQIDHNPYIASFHYPDALMDFFGESSFTEESPDTTVVPDEITELFSKIEAMQAPKPFIDPDTVYSAFSAAMNAGLGCAHYGYSENMSDMDDIIDNLTIRTISFSEKDNIPLFYADIASIGSHVTDPQKLEDCKILLNIIASKEFQLSLCLGNEEPQYILPARQSVYAELKKEYPMYGQLHKLVVNDANRVHRLGPDAYDYFESAKYNLIF